jgi:uncharacterized protein (DUF2384 family)
MTESTVTLPRGFVARNDEVAIRPKLYWAIYAWFGVALCLFVAVVMPLDTARRAAAGKEGIEMGGVIGIAVAFGVLALGTAALAVRLGRSAWVIDATGLRKRNWRRASVSWDRVSSVELKRTGRYWQVWVHAPAAVDVSGRRQSRDRLIVPAKILAPHPKDLHAFLTQQWQQRAAR